MKKSTIITIITAIIAIVVISIICVLVFNSKNTTQNDKEIIKVDTTSKDIQPDTFKAKVINKDNNQITVVANEDAAIAQVNNARIVVVLFNDKTKILKGNEVANISDIEEEQEITISYDGNIIIAQPITIQADEILFD